MNQPVLSRLALLFLTLAIAGCAEPPATEPVTSPPGNSQTTLAGVAPRKQFSDYLPAWMEIDDRLYQSANERNLIVQEDTRQQLEVLTREIIGSEFTATLTYTGQRQECDHATGKIRIAMSHHMPVIQKSKTTGRVLELLLQVPPAWQDEILRVHGRTLKPGDQFSVHGTVTSYAWQPPAHLIQTDVMQYSRIGGREER